MSLTAEYQLFLSFFGFVFSSKNISNALIMKKKHIYIYILLLQSENTSSHKGSARNCVQIDELIRGSSSCGTPNVAALLSLGSCSLLVLVDCAAAVCHSLCEFVLKEEHVRFASFGFRWRTNATFSPVPCQIYFSLIPFLFLLQVTKEMCRKPKIRRLFFFVVVYSIFIFCSFLFPNWPKRQQTRSLSSFVLCFFTFILK